MLYVIKTTPLIHTEFREEPLLPHLCVSYIIYSLTATVTKLHWHLEMQKDDNIFIFPVTVYVCLWSCASTLYAPRSF